MKKISILSAATVMFLIGGVLQSCNDFLDKLPDSRTEIDSDEKIAELMVNAYPTNWFVSFAEYMSDNIDYRGINLSAVLDRMQETAFAWEDNVYGSLWDDTEYFWQASYKAIAQANLALEAIEKAGNPARLDPQRGEALICRAFSHFYLVNIFCKHYNPDTSGTDLGIPYMEETETSVKPHYDRNTVEYVYGKIETDLLKGLALIRDNTYIQPTFHFTVKAANAFASRFYLFKGDYDKVLTYANRILGDDPLSVLVDYSELSNPAFTLEYPQISEYLTSTDMRNNILLLTPITRAPIYFGNYSSGNRYSYCDKLASTEVNMTNGLWGNYSTSTFWNRCLTYSSSGVGWVSKPGMPAYFNVTNPIAQTGHYRTVYRIFTTDLTLLERAEAYIMLGDFDKAAQDLSYWTQTQVRSGLQISRADINNHYSQIAYYQWNNPTPKKKINIVPAVPEGSELENFLSCLLHFRRIETLHDGHRWFDIKRFGLEVVHRELNANLDPLVALHTLTADDARKVIQIPSVIIDAGMEPNPR